MDMGDYVVSYDKENNKYETTEKGSTTSSTVLYRLSTDTISIGDTIDDPTKYTKDASTLGKNYYLKHVLDKDNKVTESYVCAIFNSKEYCVRGVDSSFYGYAENEADYTGNALILKKIADLKIEGINCNFDENDSSCNSDSVYLRTWSNGGAGSGVEFVGDCQIYADGRSSCG